MSSIGIEQIENERELALAYEWGQIQLKRTILTQMTQADPGRSFVFQERLQGQEHGMDVVNDLQGRHVCTLARRKLGMRSGSTDRAITVTDQKLEHLGMTLGQQLGHLGILDCDVMVTEKGCLVLDLNPRFGGGYPFSHLAGANLPAALIAWANQEVPDPSWFRARPGVLGSRREQLVVLEQEAVLRGSAQDAEPRKDGAPGPGNRIVRV
jgi:carbamoyl-phosphate synthase large subunit